MGKIPNVPDEIFEQFISDYKTAFGNNLVSVILYGSAARNEYVYKKSDINFLIIVSDLGMEQLRNALPLVKHWKKSNVATPLILTKHYIETSLDTFPIEFLIMKENYQVLFGEDVLAGLNFSSEFLRLACEREIRGKLLHLRESYLNTFGRSEKIKKLLGYTLPAFISIFSGLLALKKKKIPTAKNEIFKLTAKEFDLDYSIFDQIIKLRENSIKLKSEEISKLMERYIDQIRKLTKIVDEL